MLIDLTVIVLPASCFLGDRWGVLDSCRFPSLFPPALPPYLVSTSVPPGLPNEWSFALLRAGRFVSMVGNRRELAKDIETVCGESHTKHGYPGSLGKECQASE